LGIQGGEILGLSFTADCKLVISALKDGTLKLGWHVQALPNGQSDSYISSSGNTQDTPEPLTMLAAGAAVGFGTVAVLKRGEVCPMPYALLPMPYALCTSGTSCY